MTDAAGESSRSFQSYPCCGLKEMGVVEATGNSRLDPTNMLLEVFTADAKQMNSKRGRKGDSALREEGNSTVVEVLDRLGREQAMDSCCRCGVEVYLPKMCTCHRCVPFTE